MKNFKLLLSGMLFCASFGFGQTNVIALKSHAGSSDDLLTKTDNFGIADPMYEYRSVDSVKYNKKEKIVIQYRTYGTDTMNYKLETDSVIQLHLKAIRLNSWYPEKTKFLGFPKEIEKLAEKKREGMFLNSLPVWLVLSVAGVGFFAKKRRN